MPREKAPPCPRREREKRPPSDARAATQSHASRLLASLPPPIAPRSAYLESVSHGCFPTLRLCGRFARCSPTSSFWQPPPPQSRVRENLRVGITSSPGGEKSGTSRVKSSEISPAGPAPHPGSWREGGGRQKTHKRLFGLSRAQDRGRREGPPRVRILRFV